MSSTSTPTTNSRSPGHRVSIAFLAACLIAVYDISRLHLIGDISSKAMLEQERLSVRPIVGLSPRTVSEVQSPHNGTSSFTKVLVVRTVSPSELPIVVDDVMYVKSFYHGGQHEVLMQRSRAQCNALRDAGYAAKLDPLVNGTQAHPNHLLCNTDDAKMENYYATVRVDFMLFARSMGNALTISASIERETHQFQGDARYEVDVVIKDVSSNPKKVWNWILHCDEARLADYDYVWFIDGDITLKSLNFQAFWQQVMLLRPKITQASVIGDGSKEKTATYHPILRYHPDSRLLAGEVPMIEVQSPLLEVKTWLDYRRFITGDQEMMTLIGAGAESCFDMGWCHFATNHLNGAQATGGITRIGYKDWSPTVSLVEGFNAGIKERGCIVLYQTPIVHISKGTIDKSGPFVKVNKRLCSLLRLDHGVIGKGGLGNVYKLFSAPKIT